MPPWRVLPATAVVALALGAAAAVAAPVAERAPVDSQGLSAKQAYVQTWEATHDLFGAEARPMPRLVRDHKHQPGNLAWISEGRAGYREIRVGDGLWEMLAGGRDEQLRLAATAAIVHEFAHVYQNDEVFLGLTPAIALKKVPWWDVGPESFYQGMKEGTAEAFTRWAMHEVFGIRWQAYNVLWDEYDDYAKEMREYLPWSFLRHGQFAEHWGQSPRAIPCPPGGF